MSRIEQTRVLSKAPRVHGGRVEVRSAPASPAQAEVGVEPLLIGRNPSCAIVIKDPSVSAVHAELVATERGVRIRDLGSRNGTRVQDVNIVEAYLTDRARIWLGPVELVFEPTAPQRIGIPDDAALGPLRGSTAEMRSVFARITKVAPKDLTVLVQGETGTGKELVAQAIHQQSKRAKGPFVVVDCGAIASSLAESELFGHERGAFTGAAHRRVSPFVAANGGTLFLDELGELPLELQPKLLRALAEHRVKPVGGRSYEPFDVRVVAATRRDLAREVTAGSFRADLYFRIAQVRIDVPPLRDRQGDIPILVKHMLAELGEPAAIRRVPAESLERLMRHDWPGNVRELKNLVATAYALADEGGPIDVAAQITSTLQLGVREPQAFGTSNYHEAKAAVLEQFERQFFTNLMDASGGVIAEMAERSGLQRTHVRRYLKRHGLLKARTKKRR
jgi:transcriptional regulator with GAF, ATPase, and Fis domain